MEKNLCVNEVLNNLSEANKVKLLVSKEYINYMDEELINIVLSEKVECANEYVEESCMDAHHEIVANMLRGINVKVFNGVSSNTLSWMEYALKPSVWEAFNCMDFDIKE